MKGHKNESPEILRKTILNMADSSKNIQKKIKMLQQEHTKRVKHYYVDF